MTKNILFAMALLGAALLTGCATGGGGHTGHQIQVTVNTNPPNQNVAGVTLTVQFVATVTGTDQTAVTWSLTGTGCSGSACGTIDSNTGLYTTPNTAPAAGIPITVTATLTSSPTKTGTYDMVVLPIIIVVTPHLTTGDPLNIAKGVTQQFTAILIPDAEAQTVTWSVSCDGGANCGTIDPNTGIFNSAAATVGATGHVTATSTVDATSIDTVDVNIVKSRLAGSTTYTYRLTGFDASGAIAIAGNFTTSSDGSSITGGTEDDLTISTASNVSVTGGSLALDLNDHGTLTLNTSAGTRIYKVALDVDGDGRMIEFDNTGRHGSGQIAQADPTRFNQNKLPSGSSFAFGMTGITTTGTSRAGFVGLFKPNGAGAVNSGMFDKNEAGTSNSASDLTGTYTIAANGRGTLTLTSAALGKTYHYAMYMIGGATNKATNPMTLYIVSTDDPQTNPAVSGTVVFQDPTPGYANADFKDLWVANLTGVDSNGHTLVSLTNGAGDGNGHLNAFYFANNGGMIPQKDSNNPIELDNYAVSATTGGRYTLDLLGNPKASPVVAPVHFVLYSSAASRGFLLSIDPSTNIVYTGTMDLQPGSFFGNAELAGSLTAATSNSGTAAASQAVMNLLLSSVQKTATVAGHQDETDGGQNANQGLVGTYLVNGDGSGTVVLTDPAPANYVMYMLDNPLLDKNNQFSNIIQHFVMINVDSSNAHPSVIFGER